MKPIFLLGFMGCGKSTLGRNVAAIMHIPFIDLDIFIEQRFHRNVREIFAERGEDGFRQIERNVLHEVGDFEDTIIACGGGTPCFFDNMDFMNSHGTTVFLVGSEERIFSRLKRGKHKRPLLANLNDDELRLYIRQKIEERMPFYGKAQRRFGSDRLDSEVQVGETASRFINEIILNNTIHSEQ
ncbi:MAG: shikimate kinase [Muribaculaceae bacterium]|nr:shikimate kinase [Muribaculaceae bacterium]MBR5435703.1 shikimate kinase [Muribaculaceae bacterium]